MVIKFLVSQNQVLPSVNPWLIHVNVWQKPLQYCKVISLQLIKINEKKKKTSSYLEIRTFGMYALNNFQVDSSVNYNHVVRYILTTYLSFSWKFVALTQFSYLPLLASGNHISVLFLYELFFFFKYSTCKYIEHYMNLCHPCARAMKIFSVLFQFVCMYCWKWASCNSY